MNRSRIPEKVKAAPSHSFFSAARNRIALLATVGACLSPLACRISANIGLKNADALRASCVDKEVIHVEDAKALIVLGINKKGEVEGLLDLAANSPLRGDYEGDDKEEESDKRLEFPLPADAKPFIKLVKLEDGRIILMTDKTEDGQIVLASDCEDEEEEDENARCDLEELDEDEKEELEEEEEDEEEDEEEEDEDEDEDEEEEEEEDEDEDEEEEEDEEEDEEDEDEEDEDEDEKKKKKKKKEEDGGWDDKMDEKQQLEFVKKNYGKYLNKEQMGFLSNYGKYLNEPEKLLSYGPVLKVAGAYAATPFDAEQTHRLGFEAAGGVYLQILNFRITNDFYFNSTFGVGEEQEALFRFGVRHNLGWHSIDGLNLGVDGSFGFLQMGVTTNGEVMWTPDIGVKVDVWHLYARPAFQGFVGSESGAGFGFTLGGNIL